MCWWCKNAVPDDKGYTGCNWSRDFKPVEGWEAVEVIKNANEQAVETYRVLKCPEYEEG